jgi:hypothetical protein
MNSCTKTLPGIPVVVEVRPEVAGHYPPTVGSFNLSLDAIREVLSDRPLRRPNRTRPVRMERE